MQRVTLRPYEHFKSLIKVQVTVKIEKTNVGNHAMVRLSGPLWNGREIWTPPSATSFPPAERLTPQTSEHTPPNAAAGLDSSCAQLDLFQSSVCSTANSSAPASSRPSISGSLRQTRPSTRLPPTVAVSHSNTEWNAARRNREKREEFGGTRYLPP